MSRETCSVVYDNTCLSPANLVPQRFIRSRCYACGNAVCTAEACSRIVAWRRDGRRRICRSCFEEERREIEPMWEVSLYDGGRWVEVFAPTAAEARWELARTWNVDPDVATTFEARPANGPARRIAGQHAVRVTRYVRGTTPIRPKRTLYGYKLRCRTPECPWSATVNEDRATADRLARAHELDPQSMNHKEEVRR